MKKFYDAADPSQTGGGTTGSDTFREEPKETPVTPEVVTETPTPEPVVETPSVPEEPKPVFDAEKINERIKELKKEEPLPTAKVYEPLPASLQSAVVKEDFERVGPDGKPIRNPNAEPLPKGARAMTKDYVAHIKKEKDGN